MKKARLFARQYPGLTKALCILLLLVICVAALPSPALALSTKPKPNGTFTATLYDDGSLTIVGSGFRHNAIFAIRVQNEHHPWKKIGLLRTSSTGTINGTVKVPVYIRESTHPVYVCLKDQKTNQSTCVNAARD